MGENDKVIKAGIGYTIGNYMLKGLSFFTIPIFARMMSTSDYGLFNTYASYDGIFFVLVGLALHSSFKNAKYKYENQFNSFVSSCLVLAIISLLSWLFIGNTFYFAYGKSIGFSRVVINVLLLNSFGNAVIQYYNVYVGIYYKYRDFLKIAVFNALCSLILSIVLIKWCFPSSRYLGRILGTAIPVFVITIYIIIYFFRQSAPAYKKKFWSFATKYSLPIIPHGLSQVVLSQFDRIMITAMIGSSSSGIYSFGYNIYTLIAVTSSSLDNVWSPWFYEKMNAGDIDTIKKQSSKYALGMMLFSVLVMLVSPEIIMLLGTADYSEAVYVVIPIVAGGFFSFLYTLPVQIEYYYEKTKWIAGATFLAAILNIFLNWIYINQFGYIAAAYTTLITYCLYFVFHYIVAIRIAKKKIFNGRTIACLSVCVIVGAGSALLLIPVVIVRWAIAIVLLVILLTWINKEINIVGRIKNRISERK